jgi:CubicO group peptidase (beta-lactamase class C family)
VLIPLGMHDTGFRVPSAQRHRLVTPYRHATEGEGMAPGLFYRETEQDNRYHHQGDDAVIVGDYPYPSGGLISSVADYARFAQMLLDGGALPAAGGGGALLGRRTVQFIGTNLLPMVSGVAGADCGLLGAESDRPKPGRSNTNGGPGIGFGLGVRDFPALPLYIHTYMYVCMYVCILHIVRSCVEAALRFLPAFRHVSHAA